MARTLLRKERIPGQNRELLVYDDNTQEAVDRPQGYFDTSAPVKGANEYTEAEIRSMYGNDFTGIQKNANGFYTTDSSVKPRAKVIYNNDGTRSVLDDLVEENKPESRAEYEARQKQTKQEYANMLRERVQAIENMYVGILAKADETGRDRLGSANVINALSNQRGTPTGARSVDDVNKYNDEIRNRHLAEKADKIRTIMDENYKGQEEALVKERELREKDLDGYISYLGDKEKDKIAKSQKMRIDLISAGIKIEDIDPDTLKAMADAAGYSVDQFKVLYNADIKKKEQAFLQSEEKRISDLEKDRLGNEKLRQETDIKGNTDKDMVEKGYFYLKTPTERDQLEKSGYEIVELNGRTYAKKSAALLLAEKKKVESSFKSPTTPKKPKSTNYTATNIPSDIKQGLIEDISSKKFGKEQIYNAYPEVSTEYINSLMK